ncbi:MAG: glycosyltransferase family 1 protein [Candidatus Jorgensenbacteria bacterium]
MNILVDARVLTTGLLTGIENYTLLLLGELLRQDAKNRYSFFLNRFRSGALSLGSERVLRSPAVNWHVPNKLLDACVRFTREPKIDRLIKTDLVWSPHINIIGTTARVKHVITVHDLSWVRYPNFFSLRKRFWHWMQDVRGQVRRATRLIAVSEATRRDVIATFGVAPEKVVTVHSGVNPFFRRIPADDASLREFRARHNLAKPFFLFVGTLEPRKNVAGIVEAFNAVKGRASCRDASLVLVGRRGWLYDGIMRAIGGSPHRHDIRLWGPATEEELRYLYNLARAFVYPSLFEGFGFPVLEAQACGAPVVTSDNSSLPEVAGVGAMFVNPHDDGTLADAMEKIFADEPLRAALREKGFANVKRFSWRRAAEETLAVLEEAGNQI